MAFASVGGSRSGPFQRGTALVASAAFPASGGVFANFPGSSTSSGALTIGQWKTIVDISGAGIAGVMAAVWANTDTITLNVTIDGRTIYEGSLLGSSNSFLSWNAAITGLNVSTYFATAALPIPFFSSLKVQVKSTGTTAVTVSTHYMVSA